MGESGGLLTTVFHILEKNVGRKVLAILDPSYGFEGTLMAVTHDPPGIWISNAEAVIMRATIAQPIPQVVAKEDRSEVFLNLRNIQRVEILHKK